MEGDLAAVDAALVVQHLEVGLVDAAVDAEGRCRAAERRALADRDLGVGDARTLVLRLGTARQDETCGQHQPLVRQHCHLPDSAVSDRTVRDSKDQYDNLVNRNSNKLLILEPPVELFQAPLRSFAGRCRVIRDTRGHGPGACHSVALIGIADTPIADCDQGMSATKWRVPSP